MQSSFQRVSWAKKHLATSALGSCETTRSAQCCYSQPGTSLTKACETQFLCRPELAEVGLLLWVLYIALELPCTRPCLVSKLERGPKASCFQLFGKLRNNSLCTVLLQTTGTYVTKACGTQFLCRTDLVAVETLLWVCYIALEQKGTMCSLLSKW